MSKRCRFRLCKQEFWNDFFSPRHPGLFFILALALMDTVYTCALVLMSTYFDNFSHLQHVGYLTIFIANMIVIVCGFLSIHFLTLKPTNTKFSYCLFLHLALFCAILMVIATIVLMLTSPTPNDIREHTKRYVAIYHRAPYMMRNVMLEKQCCGITKFGDVFKVIDYADPDPSKGQTKIRRTYYRVPPACCKKQKRFWKTCQMWTEEKLLSVEEYKNLTNEYLNREPCLKKGEDFSKIRATATYSTYLKLLWMTTGVLLFFIFGILLVLNYYIWYKFPRMPEGLRPDQFIEDLNALVKCKFRKLRKSIQESKRRESEEREAILGGKKDPQSSNFEIRHHKIMQTLANVRAHEREMRHKEQQERQLLVVNSGTDLKIVSSTKVHPSSSHLLV